MIKYLTFLIFITVSISLNAQVTAQFSTNNASNEFCNNDTVVFTNSSTNFVISYWDFGDGVDTWADNPEHVYQNTGQYTVSLTVYDDAGASSTTSITINVNIAPSVFITNNPLEQSLTASSNDPDATFQWFFNGVATAETDSVVFYLEPGDFSVSATNLAGCASFAIINVDLGYDSTSVDSNQITVLNNILTPAIQDGANDVLFIEGLSYFSSACIVSIYNKWGQIVYYNSDYTNLGGFEGKDNNGQDLDAGTYLYVIKSDGKKTATGYIDLIK